MRNWRKLEQSLPKGFVAEYEPKNGALVAFLYRVAESALVVSNDTMAVHAAAALDVQAIVITNGVSGRGGFWPYPKELDKDIQVLSQDTATNKSRLIISQVNQFLNLVAITPDMVGSKFHCV